MDKKELVYKIVYCTSVPKGVTYEELNSVGIQTPLRKGWRKKFLISIGLTKKGHRPWLQTMPTTPAVAPAKPIEQPQKSPAHKRIEAFYQSYEWSHARYDALKRSNGCCELCGRGKKDGARLNVDHIKPLKLFWDLRTDPSNLQVLCTDCNKGKSNRDMTDWRKPA